MHLTDGQKGFRNTVPCVIMRTLSQACHGQAMEKMFDGRSAVAEKKF